MLQPFHLAVPTHDLAAAREFYGKFLGFEEGRSTDGWIDWNFFGHQFVTHLKAGQKSEAVAISSVDGKGVPVPHFGVVLEWNSWHEFAERLKFHKVKFVIEPYIRFRGKIGEQATMFFLDPSNNALEFKAFKDPSQLFRKYE
jgi:extradiol dioxygenase family protein